MDEVPQNQHNQNIEYKNDAAIKQDLIVEKEKLATNEFKLKWLTRTLNFIKDNKQQVLEYPEMPSGEMDFIKALISYKYNLNLGAILRPLFASTTEAIRLFQIKYDFTLKSVTKDNGAIRLVFKKSPKNLDTTINRSKKSPENSSETSICINDKMIQGKIKLISAVRNEFVLDSLQKISDFLKDKLSTSVIFKNMTMNEWMFLTNLKSLTRNRHQLSNKLSAPINKLLEQIDTNQGNDFTLNIHTFNKKDRNVIVEKIPYFPKRIPKKNLRSSSLDRQTLTNSMENLTVSISNGASNRQANIEQRSVSISNTNTNFQTTTDSQEIENSINKKIPAATKNRSRSLEKRLGPMKTKLLEAMSVPLESTKGLRMMRLMGWEGGALGPRGNGIVEPIIPPLNIVSGAGLGQHIKPLPFNYRLESSKKNLVADSKTNTKNNAGDFDNSPESILNDVVKTRLRILKEILEFVETKEDTKTVHFKKELRKNEKNFLKPAVKCFNGKQKFSLHYACEQNLVQKIQDAMKPNRDIILQVKLSKNKRALELSKIPNRVNLEASITDVLNEQSNIHENENNAEISTSSGYPKIKTKFLTLSNFTPFMNPMETYGVNTKAKFRELSFKLMVLEEIFDFVKSQDLRRIFRFDSRISPKDLNNITKYINHANKRVRGIFFTEAENSINEEILDTLGDCFLCLDYDRKYQLIIITKAFPTNSSSNSASTSSQLPTDNTVTVEDSSSGCNNEQEETSNDDVNTGVTTNSQESQFIESNSITIRSNSNSNLEESEQETKIIINKDKNYEQEEIIDQELSNVDIKDDDMVNWEEDLPDKSSELLKDIEDLEKSIVEQQTNYEELRNTKRLRTDFAPAETITYKKVKPNSLKSYKNIGIMCIDRKEMNPGAVKAIQKVLSDAIDECEDNLPLLQCHGANDTQLIYSCFDENTYHWMKGILCDNFKIEDIGINLKDKHTLQMKLRTSINIDTDRILHKIKIYNPDLDISNWIVGRKVVADDFILIDVEVDGHAWNYINQSDFSLFAGVDVAQFNITN